jgi:hypothetical protein
VHTHASTQAIVSTTFVRREPPNPYNISIAAKKCATGFDGAMNCPQPGRAVSRQARQIVLLQRQAQRMVYPQGSRVHELECSAAQTRVPTCLKTPRELESLVRRLP